MFEFKEKQFHQGRTQQLGRATKYQNKQSTGNVSFRFIFVSFFCTQIKIKDLAVSLCGLYKSNLDSNLNSNAFKSGNLWLKLILIEKERSGKTSQLKGIQFDKSQEKQGIQIKLNLTFPPPRACGPQLALSHLALSPDTWLNDYTFICFDSNIFSLLF